jgi:mannitol-1-phosphate/altronate dehydrogenase
MLCFHAYILYRFRVKSQPLTILPRNIFPANGRVLQKRVVSYCREACPALLGTALWVSWKKYGWMEKRP